MEGKIHNVCQMIIQKVYMLRILIVDPCYLLQQHKMEEDNKIMVSIPQASTPQCNGADFY